MDAPHHNAPPLAGAAPAKAPLSVVLPVRNEERNLPAALGSVEWADELIDPVR